MELKTPLVCPGTSECFGQCCQFFILSQLRFWPVPCRLMMIMLMMMNLLLSSTGLAQICVQFFSLAGRWASCWPFATADVWPRSQCCQLCQSSNPMCCFSIGRVALRPQLSHNRLCQYRFFCAKQAGTSYHRTFGCIALRPVASTGQPAICSLLYRFFCATRAGTSYHRTSVCSIPFPLCRLSYPNGQNQSGLAKMPDGQRRFSFAGVSAVAAIAWLQVLLDRRLP